MYSFPSTSQIRTPSPRATKKGSPPTLRNARTGELTPPGMRFLASAKSLDEREVIGTQKTSNPPTPKAPAWQALTCHAVAKRRRNAQHSIQNSIQNRKSKIESEERRGREWSRREPSDTGRSPSG